MASITVTTVPETGPDAPVVETPTERPAWLPENFKTPEDLVKSYTELRTKMSKGEKTENPEAAAAEDPKVNEGEGKVAEGEVPENPEKVSDFPETLQPFAQKFSEKGSFDEADYAELAKLGYSKAVVDAYVAGLTANEVADEAFLESVATNYGGVEAIQAMMEWGAQHLTDEELAVYNENATRKSTAKIAIEYLKAKYEAVNGFAPARKIEGGAKASTADVYGSWLEVQKDMATPEYKKGDPAFHAKVREKLTRSNL